MPITPRSGFSTSTSGDETIPSDIPNTQGDVLNNMPYVTDANLNKLAINEAAYPHVSRQMMGFIKGKRILVTYYKTLKRTGSDYRNNIADYPTARNVLENAFHKIKNFEMTLPQGFEFTSDGASSSIEIRGEAKLYPNSNPSVGDVFICGLGDGRTGIFQVSNVELGSWRSDSVYVIKFVLQSFGNESDITALEAAVVGTSIFSKTNYFGSTAALIAEETYLDLQKIKALRKNIIGHYYRTFFDPDTGSFTNPDGIYDPHVVRFMTGKLSLDDCKTFPKMLSGDVDSEYQMTLWARLEDRYNTELSDLYPRCLTSIYRKTRLSQFVTELVGRYYIYVTKEETGSDPYIFSDNFYTEETEEMTALEQLIYTAVKERKLVNLNAFVTNHLSGVYSLTPTDQFYHIPLYIHLIDLALKTHYREIDAPSMNYASTEG